MNWLKRSELPPLVELQGQIERWFSTELGQQLLANEQQLIDTLMPKLYGYHLLQIGVTHDIDLTKHSPAGHRFMLVPRVELGMPDTALVGEMESLPIASECVDAVVLHHALDFAVSPHQVLREAVRVLRPGGRLLIVGFNPHSFWGLCGLVQQRLGLQPPVPMPWLARFIANRRIHDWLKLLEMKSDPTLSGFFRPPLRSVRWMQRMLFCDRWGERLHSQRGAFWVISGCKESYAATPIGGWRRRFALPLSSVKTPRPVDACSVDSKPSMIRAAADKRGLDKNSSPVSAGRPD